MLLSTVITKGIQTVIYAQTKIRNHRENTIISSKNKILSGKKKYMLTKQIESIYQGFIELNEVNSNFRTTCYCVFLCKCHVAKPTLNLKIKLKTKHKYKENHE